MVKGTPWSSKEVVAGLSRESVGAELAEQVASKPIRDRGRSGLWYTHRGYCEHGLIVLEGKFCLVEYDDGFAHEGAVLKSWKTQSKFVEWLKHQSDYSLSSADAAQQELFTIDPYKLNNQRISIRRLKRYLAGDSNP